MVPVVPVAGIRLRNLQPLSLLSMPGVATAVLVAILPPQVQHQPVASAVRALGAATVLVLIPMVRPMLGLQILAAVAVVALVILTKPGLLAVVVALAPI
jgi:hypothetical protein